jgi:hypothetical protein
MLRESDFCGKTIDEVSELLKKDKMEGGSESDK